MLSTEEQLIAMQTALIALMKRSGLTRVEFTEAEFCAASEALYIEPFGEDGVAVGFCKKPCGRNYG